MSYIVRPFNASAVDAPKSPEIGPWPPDLSEAPLDLEIGCGVGWHPIQYASTHTERRLIAIEHTKAKFDRFAARLQRHPQLENLKAVHADAIRWITHRIRAETIDRCFLLYPNPEPKAPNKRWMRSPFMHRLLDCLKPEGELRLATNEIEYFNEAREWALGAWGLKELQIREITPGPTPSPRTHFEKKYLSRGQTCWEVVWKKTIANPTTASETPHTGSSHA